MSEVPIIPLNQPIHDVAMQKADRRLSVLVSPRAGLPPVYQSVISEAIRERPLALAPLSDH